MKFRSTLNQHHLFYSPPIIRRRIRRMWKTLRDSGGVHSSQPLKQNSSASSIPAGMDGVCQGCPTLPWSQGKHWCVISWKGKDSWDCLRSSRAPCPGGVGKPRRCQPWAPALASPSWVWKGQFQAMPSGADGIGALKGCQRASRKQEVLPKRKASSAQKESDFWRKTRNCSCQSCEKPWQNI